MPGVRVQVLHLSCRRNLGTNQGRRLGVVVRFGLDTGGRLRAEPVMIMTATAFVFQEQ